MPISSVKTHLVKPNLRLTGVGEKFAVEKIRFKVILTWSRLQRTLAREIMRNYPPQSAALARGCLDQSSEKGLGIGVA